MKISYYELLGMIQAGENPKLIKLELNCGERYYKAYYDADEFSHYGLKGEEKENEDFKYYLADTLLESQMIERNIEIIEEEKEIEEMIINEQYLFSNMKECTYLSPEERRLLDSNFKELSNKINELVRELNKIKKEGK